MRAQTALCLVVLAALLCAAAPQPEEEELDPDEPLAPQGAAAEEVRRRRQKKPEELREARAPDSPVVDLKTLERYEYFTTRPRRYHLIVLFTSTAVSCKPCRIIAPYYKHVAEAWREAKPDDTTLFFATVDHAHKEAKEIFVKHGVKQAPLIVHIAPTRKGVKALPFALPKDQHALTTSFAWTPEGIADFVRNRTGAEFFVENPEGVVGPPLPGDDKKAEGLWDQVKPYAGAAVLISFVVYNIYQQVQARKVNPKKQED